MVYSDTWRYIPVQVSASSLPIEITSDLRIDGARLILPAWQARSSARQ